MAPVSRPLRTWPLSAPRLPRDRVAFKAQLVGYSLSGVRWALKTQIRRISTPFHIASPTDRLRELGWGRSVNAGARLPPPSGCAVPLDLGPERSDRRYPPGPESIHFTP
ncbi:hypothetical protein ROHU_031190 [Labeo rohita]|uniref:Uncharacterized protein n=1 Tax=Labeo rohita TaxID=84645 RepID=A0A498LMI0_LABRO|nr:hypothetical protein ROHU_031463 [Labeo rohita]RXN09810.1 hypothetical protein ROHU_031190 [Labeo rohita]